MQSNALLDTNHNLPDFVYASPQITGVSLALIWGTIEPNAGVFDWSTLDAELTRAIASGKRLSITVDPNRVSAPQWLFNAGVSDLHFVVPDRSQTTIIHRNIDIAPPWDPTYQSAYAQMIQALSDHLHAIPGAYQAVSIVKITGINQITGETRLPSGTDTTGGLTNTIPVWQSVGYTPQKVIDSWKSFAASVNAAFPDKLLGLEVLNGNSFPTIDNQGQFVTTSSPSYVDVTQQIINIGLQRYAGRFAVQWDGLHGGTSVVDPPLGGLLAANDSTTDTGGSHGGLNQTISLLSNYIASTFVSSGSSDGGSPLAGSPDPASGHSPNLAQSFPSYPQHG